MQQEDLDQAYDAMVDDYLTGEIHLLSNKNLLYCIDKFGLMPALEDTNVLDVVNKLKKVKPKVKDGTEVF